MSPIIRCLMSRVAALAVALLVPTSAAAVLINNGLAPPEPSNIVDYLIRGSALMVRNEGCDTDIFGPPCPNPNPTRVDLRWGGDVEFVHLVETSTLHINGGSVGSILFDGANEVVMTSGTIGFAGAAPEHTEVSGQSRLLMTGGTILAIATTVLDGGEFILSGGTVNGFDSLRGRLTMTGGAIIGASSFRDQSVGEIRGGHVERESTGGTVLVVDARDDSLVVVSGGSFCGTDPGSHVGPGSGPLVPACQDDQGDPRGVFSAIDNAVILIEGEDFTVGGIPVGYGDLIGASGRLEGTLASGEPLDVRFARATTATITLVEVPPTMLLVENGSTPRDPENVLEGLYEQLTVGDDEFGSPTTASLVEGSRARTLEVLDQSTISIEGGSVVTLDPDLTASVVQDGGTVEGAFSTSHSYELSGGTLVPGGVEWIDGLVSLFQESARSAHGSYSLTGDEQLFLSGGAINAAIWLEDSSHLEMSYGTIAKIELTDDSTAEISGGGIGLPDSELPGGLPATTVSSLVCARNFSHVTVSGGKFCFYDDWDDGNPTPTQGECRSDGFFGARGSAEILLIGSGFEVSTNGGASFAPVGEGPLAEPTGILRGTLASGDTLDNEFYHAGAARPATHYDCLGGGGVYSGTITVPEPGAVAQLSWGLGMLAALAHFSRRARPRAG